MERPAVADYPPGAQMPPRALDDFEFVWMLRGQAVVTRDDDELALSPGELLLVPPGVRHGFVWDEARASRHGYLHFGSGDVSAALPAHMRLRPMTPDDPLAGLCAYLLWLGRGEHDWQPRASEVLGFMLRLFLAGPLPETDSQSALPPALAAAVGHLRREWSRMPLRRVGVGELASLSHVSRGSLNRLFRAGFGVSTATALEHARGSRAETLLVRTDLAVETIAIQCGFADASHFSHRFTAVHGASPRAYRAAGTLQPTVLDQPGVRRLSHLLWD